MNFDLEQNFPFAWNENLKTGFAEMDHVHEEFHALSCQMLTGTEAQLGEILNRFERHASAHFAQEEQWMDELGISGDCHKEEHEKVLASVREVSKAYAEGAMGVAVVRNLAMHLLQWFPEHSTYMDGAVSAGMVKAKHGGQPLMLKRLQRNA